MTTTQPTGFTNRSGVQLYIDETGIAVSSSAASESFVFDTPEQAHRAALAILTGPGKVDVTDQRDLSLLYLRDAVRSLNQHFEILDAEAAAKAEAAELEAEAEQLYTVYINRRPKTVRIINMKWTKLPEGSKEDFRTIAREARRLHTNKEDRS